MRLLAVLLISGMLFLAVIPLTIMFSSSSSDVHSSPEYIPVMRVLGDVDKDHDKVEDVLEEEVQGKIAGGNGTQLVKVVVLLDSAPTSVQTSFFGRNSGTVALEVWQHAVYGFGGKNPYVFIDKFAGMCPGLLLVQKDN